MAGGRRCGAEEDKSTMTDQSDLDTMLAAAAHAARVYADISFERRAAFLATIAESVEDAGDDLVATADRETHLGSERLTGELARTTAQIRMFADLIRDGSHAGARIELGPPDIRRMLIPLGPVAVFGASNFPLAFSVPGGDTASALAAGCPVVCKAHPAHTETGALAAAAIDAAVAEVLAANPDKLAEYRAGKDKLFGFFVGQAMRAMGGKANPALVNEAVKRNLL